jgi:hypothetical protein
MGIKFWNNFVLQFRRRISYRKIEFRFGYFSMEKEKKTSFDLADNSETASPSSLLPLRRAIRRRTTRKATSHKPNGGPNPAGVFARYFSAKVRRK